MTRLICNFLKAVAIILMVLTSIRFIEASYKMRWRERHEMGESQNKMSWKSEDSNSFSSLFGELYFRWERRTGWLCTYILRKEASQVCFFKKSRALLIIWSIKDKARGIDLMKIFFYLRFPRMVNERCSGFYF